jgi:hypothetical protein
MPRDARAQTTSDAPTQAVEHSAYERAVEAFERGDHAVALQVFRELHESTQLDALRFNIGVCLEQLGSLAAARDEFAAVAASRSVPAATRAEAIESVARLRTLLGLLTIRGPEGARALLDGAPLCTLPCDPYVNAGAHVVTLDVPNGSRVSVEAVAGENRAVPLRVVGPEAAASIGALTVIGSAVAVLGVVGVVGFGIRTLDLKGQFDAGRTNGLMSEGTTMRDLTNVSIGVAILGAAFVVLDLILVATAPDRRERRVRLDHGGLAVSF